MTLRLRPHHVLCALGFDGHGYAPVFTANLNRIVHGQLRAPGGEDLLVRITGDADAICAPCPKRIGLGCQAQTVIDALDRRHGEALGLAPGDKLRWGQCLDKVRARVGPEDLDHLCSGCSWLGAGICKAAVARLIRDRKEAAPEDGL
jgi:hypothetical protein